MGRGRPKPALLPRWDCGNGRGDIEMVTGQVLEQVLFGAVLTTSRQTEVGARNGGSRTATLGVQGVGRLVRLGHR